MRKHSAFGIQQSAIGDRTFARLDALTFARSFGALVPVFFVLTFAFLTGCQVHPVQLPTTGRTVTLDEIRRTQRSAGARLSRVAARLDLDEWRYVRPGGNAAPAPPTTTPSGNPAELERRALMQGTRIRYLWDDGHQRLAMRIQSLGQSAAASQPAGEVSGPARVQIVQRVGEDEEWSASLQDNVVVLERFGRNHPLGARALNDSPLKHGLENDSFFAMAENWGGRLEAVHEDGLDLVKVTWSAMGVETSEWFRPDQGLRLHRKETRDLQRRLHSRIAAGDYRNINGFPYPFSYEVTMWDDWNAMEVTQMHRCRVHSADFGVQPDGNEFMLDIPAGAVLTRVLDEQTLLPGVRNRARISDRVDQALRADVIFLFGMMQAPASQPAESANVQTR